MRYLESLTLKDMSHFKAILESAQQRQDTIQSLIRGLDKAIRDRKNERPIETGAVVKRKGSLVCEYCQTTLVRCCKDRTLHCPECGYTLGDK